MTRSRLKWRLVISRWEKGEECVRERGQYKKK
jgi:hypothetical protein